jgi:hypothetical protein
MLGFFKRFVKYALRTHPCGHKNSFQPDLEGLGGRWSGSSGRRHPMRPEVEQLEERRLMSSSGVISAITDNRGQTVAFEIGSNGQVYELNPAVSSGWFALVDYNPAGFRQVSAGLDAYG